jgi:high affinity Mn2+ porin
VSQAVLHKSWWASVAVAFGIGQSAAADLTRPAPAPYRWTGWYAGGHFGLGSGSYGPGTNPTPHSSDFLQAGGAEFIAGYQAGYNFQTSSNIVLGIEADVTFGSPHKLTTPPQSNFETVSDTIGTARGRIGYASGIWLPYVTGGLAFGKTRIHEHDSNGDIFATKAANHWGWTIGAGLEFALTGSWTAKVEYDYVDLGSKTYDLMVPSPSQVTVDPKFHLAKVGLNYRFADTPAQAASSRIAESDAWSIHGQTTLIYQGYGSFRSPYQGANSLPGNNQVRNTWTTTAFVGRKLWDGGEFYINPELAQGGGIGATLGLGGFSNGEAQKAGAPYPRVRAQRYFVRQTFGFGGGQETFEDGPNQFAGKRDIDRITVTVGRFAVGDIFDANSYAHDPRADFLNWALWSAAAYDFPADLPGFTRGAVAELNRENWAVRAGVFQVPNAPNGDVLKFNTGGALVEFESRYTIYGKPGKARIGAFSNRGQTANYRDAIAAVAADPTVDINEIVPEQRRTRQKSGFYLNLEQSIDRDVGVFARASWNDGKTEILSFTDIDRSLSGGASIKGRAWSRPNDTLGIGGAVNGLSSAHHDFLGVGGLGLLIGDGRINYGTERIIETFYAINVLPQTTLTFDYQFIDNPAYNRDRGPVSIFATRFHAEF